MTPRLRVHPVDTAWADRMGERLARLRYVGLCGSEAEARQVADAVVERMAPQSRVLVVGDGDGYAWLISEGQDITVQDVVLADLGLVAPVRDEVQRLARADGAPGLVAIVAPGEAAQRAFADDDGFAVVATQMRLDLPAPAGRREPRTPVELRPMTHEEFAAFFAGRAESHAAERQAAGEPAEVARATAQRQLGQLLPTGLDSPDQRLFTAWSGDPVGSLWLSTAWPTVFVYDIVVGPEQRRRGYGEAIMRAAERWAERHRAIGIGLNVFGHNAGARALYDGLGYSVTEETHRKSVGRVGTT